MASVSVTSTSRTIALIDMDCFYVQVEERDEPAIKGVPAAVVQYNAYKGGGIIAVNYEARARGVTRHIRGDDAKAVCPEIKLVRVPEVRGKADLTKYRDAGKEVIDVLIQFSSCVERASIDEAYVDLTDAVEKKITEVTSQGTSWEESVIRSLNKDYFASNFVLGYESTDAWFEGLTHSELPSIDDVKLAIGAEIVGKMRAAVYDKTSFRCSAGIGHNKILAKLACGINKPNKQTVVPHSSVPSLWSTTKVGKVRGLGGKLGDYLTGKMGCENICDVGRFSERELAQELGSKTGAWIYQLVQGYDDEPVTPRQLPKSIGCNKNFSGPEALRTKEKVKFWISQLAAEVVERVQRDLETNNRRAKTLTLHVKFENQNSLSRSCGVNPQYNTERMAADVYSIMEKLYQTVGVLPVSSLGLIASKFEDEIDTSSYGKISSFFKSKSSADGSNEPTSSSAKLSQRTAMPNNSNSSEGQCNQVTAESKKLAHFGSEDKTKDFNSVTVANTTNSSNTSSNPSVEEGSSVVKIPLDVLPNDSSCTSSTPEKNNISNDANGARKPFFTFKDSVPKLMSPRKSPRKAIPVSNCKSEESNSVSTNAGAVLNNNEHVCERCGKKFDLRGYNLHMDYHFARDLSREINGLPQLDNAVSNDDAATGSGKGTSKITLKRPRGRGGLSSGSSSKRGRGSSKPNPSTSAQGHSRTIDSYFGQRS